MTLLRQVTILTVLTVTKLLTEFLPSGSLSSGHLSCGGGKSGLASNKQTKHLTLGEADIPIYSQIGINAYFLTAIQLYLDYVWPVCDKFDLQFQIQI